MSGPCVLCTQAVRTLGSGKRDGRGRPLVPADSELDADRIAQIVAARLERRVHLESITARVALLEALRQRPAPLTLTRQPYFCSGCPHNRSTVLPEGSDRKSTRLNSSHLVISYAVFCLKK